MPDLAKAMGSAAGKPEAKIEDLPFARPQVLHEKLQSFLAFGNLPKRRTFIIGHGFGQLKIAVIVKDGIQGDRRSRGCLQMGQMFEAAASSGGQLLGAG